VKTVRTTRTAGLVVIAALAALVGLADDGWAQEGKKPGKGKGKAEPAAGSSQEALVVTLVLDGGRLREDVEVREEKWAKVKFKDKAGKTEELEGEKILEMRLRSPAQLLSGQSAFRGGVFDRAVQSFTAVRNGAAEGSSVWAHATYWLGESQRMAGNATECVTEQKKLLDKLADHYLAPAALLSLGKAQAASGQADQGTTTLQKLSQGYGDLWQLKGKLAEAETLLEAKKYSPARGAFEVVQQGAARHPTIRSAAQVGIGQCYVGDKRYDDAVKFFEGIIGSQSNDAEVAGGAWTGIGDCRYEQAKASNNDQNKLKEALIAYQVATTRFAGTRSYAKALYMAGECLRALNKPELAKRMDEELLGRCPKTEWARKRKG
jgi:TolA-binding protein